VSDAAQPDQPRTVAYGEWESPISAGQIAAGSLRLGAVAIDEGRAVWEEGRPSEDGRTVLAAHDGTGVRDLLTSDADVRSTTHEYGGGSFAVAEGVAWYVHFPDQRVYRRVPDVDPEPITPEPDTPRSIRYADLSLSADGRRLLAVRERHTDDGVERDIVSIAPAGGEEVTVLTTGHDFYAAPRMSPDGLQLAWLAWDHPRMPWDGTELWVADLAPDGSLRRRRLVAGGPEQAVAQPTWAPDGSLWFVNDPHGWWNLFRLNTDGEVEAMTAEAAEYAWPAWVFGIQTFGFLDDGRVVAIENSGGIQRIVTLEPGSKPKRTKLRFTAIAPRLACDGRNVVFVGGTATEPMSVVRWDPVLDEVSVLRASSNVQMHPDDVSLPRAIEFPTTGGRTAHAFYYPPRNGAVTGTAEHPTPGAPDVERPPLIVKSHGGPTSQSPAVFDLSTQYWTTRGFAVVDVNYGGSTGYGRAYRERLKGQWGIVDVDDCVNAARFLAESGHVDGRRMAIRGGSAGGFTTLCALTFHDDFAAGASYFGVADAKLLAEHTHDFESRYLDGLIGSLDEAAELYEARSPIHHTDQLRTPVIVLQGLEDAVVPPSQAEAMVAACQERAIPHAYLTFEGEQHGFRRADSIVAALEAELAFYGQVMGFSPPGVEPIELRGATTGQQ
jgi:dipeptidyl aminopeptidase/acylaminoacyl peptidase